MGGKVGEKSKTLGELVGEIPRGCGRPTLPPPGLEAGGRPRHPRRQGPLPATGHHEVKVATTFRGSQYSTFPHTKYYVKSISKSGLSQIIFEINSNIFHVIY